MKDKLELQKQYIEVKNKYDELSEKYWSLDTTYYSQEEIREELHIQIKEQFLLLKSLNKQIYYEG
jgi:hypothetical protein